MNIRLLRGQVVVRENLTADTDHYRHIIVPGISDAERHDPDAIQRARKWHRGTVLAMGAPMLSKGGVEIAHGFAVGDEVIFHWAHREKSWTREWVDGELACWVPQAFVDAVLEPETRALMVDGLMTPEDRQRFAEAVEGLRRGDSAIVLPGDASLETLQ